MPTPSSSDPPADVGGYAYDVAFSFLQADEAIALQLKEALSQQFSVFVYSERQRELAGTDGMDTFSDVFAKQAHVCVILFREGWGRTKWTRIEETAIKSRAFDSGWDFLLVIGLGPTPTAPRWLPPTKIWLGFEQFGAAGAVAVIHARVGEAGGVAQDESPVDKAKRMARRVVEAQTLERRLRSDEGVSLARGSVDRLFAYLRETVGEIMSARPDVTDVSIGCEENRQQPISPILVVRTPKCSVTIQWEQTYSNSLKGSGLVVTRFEGPFIFGGYTAERRELNRRSYAFGLDCDGSPLWVDQKKKNGERVSSRMLADQELSWVVDKLYG